MPYFVVYQINRRDHEPIVHNIILRRTHPVIWAANPPEVFTTSGLSNTLLFFAEISDEIVEQVALAKWVSIET